MTACAPLYRPFASAPTDLPRGVTATHFSPSFCGAEFTSVAGLRVDSPWISP